MKHNRTGIYGQISHILCFICICLAALSPLSCKRRQSPAPPPPAVSVSQPIRANVTDYIESSGNTQPAQTVQLRARVTGYLEKILFKDGEIVAQDQPLFIIQQNTYQSNLRQAEAAIALSSAQLRYAENQFMRYTALLEEDSAAKSDVDNWRYQRDSAQANLRDAEAKRDLAKLELGYTEIRAPFAGRIDRTLVDMGNLVGQGEATVLTNISRIDPINVYFTISDIDLSRLTGGSQWTPRRAGAIKLPIDLGLLTEKGFPHRGFIDFASISLNNTSGTLLLRGIFPNPSGTIIPGLYARVRIPAKTGPALLVPQEAIGHDLQGAYVLAANPENIIERYNIVTGSQKQSYQVVRKGLTGAEWVVVKGLQKAIIGRPVSPRKLSLEEPDLSSEIMLSPRAQK